MQCVENCDDPNPRHHILYEQPVWQTLQMFRMHFLPSVCVVSRDSDRTLRTSRRNVMSVIFMLLLFLDCGMLPSRPLFTPSSPLYTTRPTSSRFGRPSCERAVHRSQAQVSAPSRIQSAPSMVTCCMRLNRHNGPSPSSAFSIKPVLFADHLS